MDDSQLPPERRAGSTASPKRSQRNDMQVGLSGLALSLSIYLYMHICKCIKITGRMRIMIVTIIMI